MNRRDLLLNEMNITQWVLTKPQVLKGDAQIRLSEQVKFVVVCEENQQQSGFFQDVLRALDLKSDEYQWLTLEQTMRLAFDHSPIF
ncbi:DNA polymerase III subunit psi, partial [Glaesserella sp.]|uniref:DNA polymerase III subunit psi n=1 Tax=Glaesserella sp. TaxID=2094731 RepID=UPI0035A02DAB